MRSLLSQKGGLVGESRSLRCLFHGASQEIAPQIPDFARFDPKSAISLERESV